MSACEWTFIDWQTGIYQCFCITAILIGFVFFCVLSCWHQTAFNAAAMIQSYWYIWLLILISDNLHNDHVSLVVALLPVCDAGCSETEAGFFARCDRVSCWCCKLVIMRTYIEPQSGYLCETSLYWALSLGSQHDPTCICCWVWAPAADVDQ